MMGVGFSGPSTVSKVMEISFPPLEVGRSYCEAEVRPHVAEDDLSLVKSGFPKDLKRWPHDSGEAWREGEKILFEYIVWDMRDIRPQVEEYRASFLTKPAHWDRVSRIKSLLEGGDVAYPIFAQFNDPRRRITEGIHRSIAMLELAVGRVPVLLAKYADWTPETPS
jgi:hypothetical protein